MSEGLNLPRRSFLRAALIGAGVLSLAGLPGCDDGASNGEGGEGGVGGAINPPTPDQGAPPAPMGKNWVERLEAAQAVGDSYFTAGLDGAKLVGERYLARHAPGADGPTLATLLAPTLQILEASEEPAQAAEAAEDAVSADFTALQLVVQDGWTLSRTEAHLCALVFLANAG